MKHSRHWGRQPVNTTRKSAFALSRRPTPWSLDLTSTRKTVGLCDALSQLLTAAPRCEPSFLDRPLARNVPAPELRAKGLLSATWKSLETDPHEAAKFAQGVADHVPTLRGDGDVIFVRGLRKLREQLPAEADRLFRNSLSSVAATGMIWDLFTLGNYVFCPIPERTDIPELVTTLPDGSSSAYLLSAVRPEIPNELVGQYVATAIEMLLTRGTPTTHDAESLALALQLASWAETNAPDQSSTLSSFLGIQTDSPGIRRQLSEHREQIERVAVSERLEEELESTVDKESKSRASFRLCMNRIDEGKFSQAEDLLDDIGLELRRILRDFIGLQRATEAIANDELEDATIAVAGLKDSLHQVLGGLSLASGYRARVVDQANLSEEDRDAADRALRHAMGAAANVSDHLRPHARIAVVAVLAKCNQDEEALRVLELALQELVPDQSQEETDEEESEYSVTAHPWGGFGVEISDGHSATVQDLHPPNLRGANFEEAVHHLSVSPGVDLDRLDAIVSMAADRRMRALGMVAVATGALARAFNTGTE